MQVSSRNINQWINYFSLFQSVWGPGTVGSRKHKQRQLDWDRTDRTGLETEITNQFMRSESHCVSSQCPAPPAMLTVTSKSDAFNHLLGGIKTIIATPRFSALELCSPQVKWQNVRKTRRNQRVREYRETFWCVLSWVRMFSQWCNTVTL